MRALQLITTGNKLLLLSDNAVLPSANYNERRNQPNANWRPTCVDTPPLTATIRRDCQMSAAASAKAMVVVWHLVLSVIAAMFSFSCAVN